MTFSLDRLNYYYNTFFQKDWKRYFNMISDDDGICGVLDRNGVYHSPVQRRRPQAVLSHFFVIPQEILSGEMSSEEYYSQFNSSEPVADSQSPVDPDGDLEQELYFIGLIGAIYQAQSQLMLFLNNDRKELEHFLTSLGYPIIWPAISCGVSKTYDQFLSDCYLNPEVLKEEVRVLYPDVVELTYPFVYKIISEAFRNWNNHIYEDKGGYVSSLADRLDRSLDNVMFEMRRHFTPQLGLTGISFDKQQCEIFYNQKYPQLLKRYFKVSTGNGDYPAILSLDYRNNKRLADGQIGNDATENIMFAVAFLYQVLAEQSVTLHVEDWTTFYRLLQWPWISTGPGAGNYVNAVLMLSEAGLAPSYGETLLFLEAFKKFKLFYSDYFRSVINGARMHFSNDDDRILFRQTYNGHVRPRIIQEMSTLVDQAQMILEQRIQNPDLSWAQLIKKLCKTIYIKDM